jgi:hypothetical protein
MMKALLNQNLSHRIPGVFYGQRIVFVALDIALVREFDG